MIPEAPDRERACEIGKRGKPTESGLMSGLLLWATGVQSCRGPSERLCETHWNYLRGHAEAAMFLYQLSLLAGSAPMASKCPYTKMQGTIGVNRSLKAVTFREHERDVAAN